MGQPRTMTFSGDFNGNCEIIIGGDTNATINTTEKKLEKKKKSQAYEGTPQEGLNKFTWRRKSYEEGEGGEVQEKIQTSSHITKRFQRTMQK